MTRLKEQKKLTIMKKCVLSLILISFSFFFSIFNIKAFDSYDFGYFINFPSENDFTNIYSSELEEIENLLNEKGYYYIMRVRATGIYFPNNQVEVLLFNTDTTTIRIYEDTQLFLRTTNTFSYFEVTGDNISSVKQDIISGSFNIVSSGTLIDWLFDFSFDSEGRKITATGDIYNTNMNVTYSLEYTAKPIYIGNTLITNGMPVITESDYKNPPGPTFDYTYSFLHENIYNINSIDYTLQNNIDYSNTSFKYEISFDPYLYDNPSNQLYVENFEFIGLVNDNGMYHWEKINQGGFAVDNYNESYSNDKYIFIVENILTDFSKYEKVIFRTKFFNSYRIENAVTYSNNSNIWGYRDVFYNTIFHTDYINVMFSLKPSEFVNFSTPSEQYAETIYSWLSHEINDYKDIPYLNYFNNSTMFFESYHRFIKNLSLVDNSFYDYIYYSDVQIGKSFKRGFSINRRINIADNFNVFMIFKYNNLYYSYNINNKNLGGDIYNDNGDRVTVDNSLGNPENFECTGWWCDISVDTFGLTSIITAPLNMISKITNSSCSPLVLPLPYVNKDIALPCMETVYQQYFGDFFTLYQNISFGVVSYWVIVKVLNLVKDFKDPKKDQIEVIDL